MKYVHTNLTVHNLESMVRFYRDVFECVPIREVSETSGSWLEDVTGVPGAVIRYVHLRLPGFGENGPQLELLQYLARIDDQPKKPNLPGFGHVAFSVPDVESVVQRVCAAGGGLVNKVAVIHLAGRGRLTEAYAHDPEGNIIELQHYSREENQLRRRCKEMRWRLRTRQTWSRLTSPRC